MQTLSLFTPSSNSKKRTFLVDITFVSKVLSPNLSKYLNIIVSSRTLLSYGFGGRKLKKIKFLLYNII